MKLALQIPWGTNSAPEPINYNPVDVAKFAPSSQDLTLSAVINQFGNVAIYIGGFLMFIWAVWGVFDYIRGEGNKEALAKARKRIQWAIAGFIILLLSFFLSSAIEKILSPRAPDLNK